MDWRRRGEEERRRERRKGRREYRAEEGRRVTQILLQMCLFGQ